MVDRLHQEKVLGRGNGPPPPGAMDFFYLHELRLQCDFAISSFGEIQTRVAANSKDLSLFAFAHMLLVFASNAMKLLFPSPKASPNVTCRAERLRSKLGVEGTPPDGLIEARNYLEHFDERMDRFVGSQGDGLLGHGLITDVVSDEVELDDGRRFKARFLRLLETRTMRLSLYDQSVSLPDLVHEIAQLRDAAERTLAKEIGATEIDETGGTL